MGSLAKTNLKKRHAHGNNSTIQTWSIKVKHVVQNADICVKTFFCAPECRVRLRFSWVAFSASLASPWASNES